MKPLQVTGYGLRVTVKKIPEALVFWFDDCVLSTVNCQLKPEVS